MRRGEELGLGDEHALGWREETGGYQPATLLRRRGIAAARNGGPTKVHAPADGLEDLDIARCCAAVVAIVGDAEVGRDGRDDVVEVAALNRAVNVDGVLVEERRQTLRVEHGDGKLAYRRERVLIWRSVPPGLGCEGSPSAGGHVSRR
jgi:hypothetical protein